MFCRPIDGLASDGTVAGDSATFLPRCVALLNVSVVIFLVRASSFENDVAWHTILGSEAELRLVEDVFLGLLMAREAG
jgi:hypothetical protein